MMNFYSFHIGDYATRTRHLSMIEDLAYRRMLDLYYTTEQPLPLDVEKVARLIGMRDHMQSVSDVVSDFFLKSEDGYRNKRADGEIERYHAKAVRAKGANLARWASKDSDSGLKSDAKSDADLIPTNNQEPLTINQEPKIKNKKPRTATPVAELDFSGWPSKPSESVLAEWLAMRKRKRAAVTQLVVNQFGEVLHQAAGIGWTVDEVLSKAVMRNWQGLEIDWLPPKRTNNPTKPTAADSFHGKQYTSTPREQLDPIFQEALREAGL